MTRILLADDHKIMRDGLKRILGATPDLSVVGEAANGDELLRLLRTQECDVAIVDLAMPGLSGFALIRRLRIEKTSARILVLSMHSERQYAARALKAGASGYLNKDSAGEQLVGVVRKLAAGGVHIGDATAASLISEERGPHEQLSDREMEVLRLLVDGLTPSDVGERLHLSVKTVSSHKTRILEKLNIGSTAELVRYALQHGLVE